MASDRQTQSSSRGSSIVRHGILMLAAFVMLYPLLWMIGSSFKPENLIFSDPSPIPKVWDFGNYASGWHALRVSFTTFYANSFLIAALAVIGNLSACSLTAFAFARLNSASNGSGSR